MQLIAPSKTIATLKSADFTDEHDQYNFRSEAREVYIARDEIGRNRYVYVVGIAGDPHSTVTEITLADAKTTATDLLNAPSN